MISRRKYEKDRHSSHQLPIRIRRADIQELTLIQITAEELEMLKHGAPDSTYQTCAFSLFSMATSFLISFLTVQLSHRLLVGFVAVTAVTYGASVPLFIVWLRRRKSAAELVKKIQSRLKTQ
jgi:hypothetical protein